jgi:hypothetical protein
VALWKPNQISTALWLDASDSSTITISTGVSAWDDKSGNGHDVVQSSSSSFRPSRVTADLNSLDVISFDGVDDYLAGSSSNIASNVNSALVFVVHKYASEPTTPRTLLRVQSSGTTARMQLTVAVTTSKKRDAGGRRLDGDSYQSVTAAADCSTSWKIASVAYDFQNSNLDQYINGTVDGTTSSFQTDGRSANSASSGIYIGATNAPNNFAPAKIAEIIIVHDDVTSTTRQLIEGYLANKWGLATNLPSGHPYKSAAPTIADPECTVSIPGILDAPKVTAGDYFAQVSIPGILEASAPASVLYNDISVAIPANSSIRYVMDLFTPSGNVRVPVSSWQATLQVDRQNFVQCVIPACLEWVDIIGVATGFAISSVAIDVNIETLIASISSLDVPRFDRGPTRYTCTLSGYETGFVSNDNPDSAYDRTLIGIRSTSAGPRVRCNIDFFLRPGQRAWADDIEIIVDYINYYCTGTDAYMDVGQRG